jgi:phosphatidylserine/phosphatidylglycerophosphate/cardiolipin synthase-like enzyme
VIDAETVITGSYNFTFSAQNRNSENVLIIKSNALAARYSENWLRHQRDATPYKLP